MTYPEVSFRSSAFRREPAGGDVPDPWFAGEDLARALIADLDGSGSVSIDPGTALVEEDWGWCIRLKVNGMSFFLGVGADLDEERDWKVFIAKDFGFFARLFRGRALETAVATLKTALETVLNHRDDVTDRVWTREGEGSG